jgi:hypothetical protein
MPCDILQLCPTVPLPEAVLVMVQDPVLLPVLIGCALACCVIVVNPAKVIIVAANVIAAITAIVAAKFFFIS